MTSHSEALLLVFSFSLCGSLCAVSLNRNERAHFWVSTDPEPATSSSWTSQSTEMDMTSPTDVLYSEVTSRDLEVDPSVDQNPYVTMEDRGLSRLPASRTPWIKTWFPLRLNHLQISRTMKRDLKQRHLIGQILVSKAIWNNLLNHLHWQHYSLFLLRPGVPNPRNLLLGIQRHIHLRLLLKLDFGPTRHCGSPLVLLRNHMPEEP